MSRRLVTSSLAAASLLLLAGCASADHDAVPAASVGTTTRSAGPTSKPAATTPPKAPAPASSTKSAPEPTGTAAHRPAAPPFVTTSTDTVPGLTAAISKPGHPGLAICDAHLASILVNTGDIRGNGGTQYLVDTTCDGATASTPDEIALYERIDGSLTRSAVIYAYTVNRPTLTAQPYLDGPHTVVLTYNQGARYSLVTVTPDRVVQGELRRS